MCNRYFVLPGTAKMLTCCLLAWYAMLCVSGWGGRAKGSTYARPAIKTQSFHSSIPRHLFGAERWQKWGERQTQSREIIVSLHISREEQHTYLRLYKTSKINIKAHVPLSSGTRKPHLPFKNSDNYNSKLRKLDNQ